MEANPSLKYAERRPLFPVAPTSELRQHCYLCGNSKMLLEVEHVVPRIMFAPNSPPEYVKLWSCRSCNKTKGKDDEYVTRYLQATSFTSAAKQGFGNAIRGFQRPLAGRGIHKDMIDRMKKVEVRSAGGIHLGATSALLLDSDRVNRFCSTIAKGLWTRNSLVLPDWDKYDVTVDVKQLIQDDDYINKEPWVSIRDQCFVGQYWQGVFSYFGGWAFASNNYLSSTTEQPSASFWCLLFYSMHAGIVIFTEKGTEG